MIERARTPDPTATAILADKAVIVYRAGDRALGRAPEQRVLALNPANIGAHRDLARMAVSEGRSADAQAEWRRVASLGDNVRGAIVDRNESLKQANAPLDEISPRALASASLAGSSPRTA